MVEEVQQRVVGPSKRQIVTLLIFAAMFIFFIAGLQAGYYIQYKRDVFVHDYYTSLECNPRYLEIRNFTLVSASSSPG